MKRHNLAQWRTNQQPSVNKKTAKGLKTNNVSCFNLVLGSGQASNLAELLTCAVVSFDLLKLLLALSLTLTMIETLNVKSLHKFPQKHSLQFVVNMFF